MYTLCAMGSAASRLRSSLKSGDERGAINAWSELMASHGSDRLSKSLSEELGMGDEGNTVLHYAALHGMANMVPLLLDSSCNPLQGNARQRNIMHMLCDVEGSTAAKRTLSTALFSSPGAQPKYVDAQRAVLLDKVVRRCKEMSIDIHLLCTAGDDTDMTPLHLAAANGLFQCSVRLLNEGASVFATDSSGATLCDIAAAKGHSELAVLLSSKMIFSHGPDGTEDVDQEEFQGLSMKKGYTGLNTQEIIAIKDKLLLETADMLRVPLHVAAVLLRLKDWSRETLMDAWLVDSSEVLRQASLSDDVLQQSATNEHSLVLHQSSGTADTVATTLECTICYGELTMQDSPPVPCGHRFCMACWKEFLAGKIEEGASDNIPCPSSECSAAVPVELVDHLMPPEMRRRYEHFDVKAFVAASESLRWCPMVGCDRAIQIESSSQWFNMSKGSMAVDCGRDHYSCWQCAEPAHEPCTCEMMREWRELVAEHRKDQHNTEATRAEHEKAASDLWLAGNSKPCPKCSAPIERTEGCNHMTCQRCKHEFCWMCHGEWKLHSNATGGYFRCYRDEAKSYQSKLDTDLAKIKENSSAAERLANFSSQYEKITDHSQRLVNHQTMLDSVEQIMSSLLGAIKKCDSAQGVKPKFLQPVLSELVLARQTLSSSCVYLYHLLKNSTKRRNGEPSMKVNMYTDYQRGLEQAVDDLCGTISVRYIQASHPCIVKKALVVRNRRVNFVETVFNGILPEGAEEEQEQAERVRQPLRLPFFLRNRAGSGNSDDDDGNAHGGGLAALYALYMERMLLQGDEATCEREGCMRPRSRLVGRFCSPSCQLIGLAGNGDDDSSASDDIVLTPIPTPPLHRRVRFPPPQPDLASFDHSPPNNGHLSLLHSDDEMPVRPPHVHTPSCRRVGRQAWGRSSANGDSAPGGSDVGTHGGANPPLPREDAGVRTGSGWRQDRRNSSPPHQNENHDTRAIQPWRPHDIGIRPHLPVRLQPHDSDYRVPFAPPHGRTGREAWGRNSARGDNAPRGSDVSSQSSTGAFPHEDVGVRTGSMWRQERRNGSQSQDHDSRLNQHRSWQPQDNSDMPPSPMPPLAQPANDFSQPHHPVQLPDATAAAASNSSRYDTSASNANSEYRRREQSLPLRAGAHSSSIGENTLNAIAPTTTSSTSLQPSDVLNILDRNPPAAVPAPADSTFEDDLARAIALSLGRDPDEPSSNASRSARPGRRSVASAV